MGKAEDLADFFGEEKKPSLKKQTRTSRSEKNEVNESEKAESEENKPKGKRPAIDQETLLNEIKNVVSQSSENMRIYMENNKLEQLNYQEQLKTDIEKANQILETLLSNFGVNLPDLIANFHSFQKDIQKETPEAVQEKVVFSYIIRFHSDYHKKQNKWLLRRMGEVLHSDLRLSTMDDKQFETDVWLPLMKEGLLIAKKQNNYRFMITEKALQKYKSQIDNHPIYGIKQNLGTNYYITRLNQI